MLSNFEKAQSAKILSMYTNVESSVKDSLANEWEHRSQLYKAQEDKELESFFNDFEKLEKSESIDDQLVKSLSGRIHKYISKIGDKYIYKEKPPLNDLRDYHSAKTCLDSVKESLSHASHPSNSSFVKDVYDVYKQKAQEFKGKYGHEHDSKKADNKLKEVRDHMLDYIHAYANPAV